MHSSGSNSRGFPEIYRRTRANFVAGRWNALGFIGWKLSIPSGCGICPRSYHPRIHVVPGSASRMGSDESLAAGSCSSRYLGLVDFGGHSAERGSSIRQSSRVVLDRRDKGGFWRDGNSDSSDGSCFQPPALSTEGARVARIVCKILTLRRRIICRPRSQAEERYEASRSAGVYFKQAKTTRGPKMRIPLCCIILHSFPVRVPLSPSVTAGHDE